MISGCALVQVPAADTVGIQNEARRTRADEAALGVLAVVFARFWRQFALINIDAVNAGFISLVTFIADASIGTESVDAQAISAEIGYSLALVDILSVYGKSFVQTELIIVI